MVTTTIEGPDDQSGHVRPIPFIAKVAGVKDEIAFYSDDVGPQGRHWLKKRGWWNLGPPGVLAILVSIAGFVLTGYVGLCFGLMFFAGNIAIQSIANPAISERKAMLGRSWDIATLTYILLLVSGTFAAVLVAWLLFKPMVDQRHRDDVAKVMELSQEKQNQLFTGEALAKERASLLSKQQVSSQAIDRASAAYSQAQDLAAKANAAYQEEIAKGAGGRKPGDGPAAKALWQALLTAKASEDSAKVALEEARAQVVAPSPELTTLTDAYNAAKVRYEEKEKALIDAGPGLLKTFWWLLDVVHKEPGLIAFVLVWAFFEALSVIHHSHAGRNVYERARYTTIQDEMALRSEIRRLHREQAKELAAHNATLQVAKGNAKVLAIEAKDRAQR